MVGEWLQKNHPQLLLVYYTALPRPNILKSEVDAATNLNHKGKVDGIDDLTIAILMQAGCTGVQLMWSVLRRV